jgi:hypothetical protein
MASPENRSILSELERQHHAVGEWLTQMHLASDFLLGKRDRARVQQLAHHYRRWVEPHFRYEEQHLFPAIRQATGGGAIIARLAAFEEEHRVLEARVETLLQDLETLMDSELNEVQAAETARRCRLIIDRLLLHAAQEDDLLQPLMEQHREALTKALGEAPSH